MRMRYGKVLMLVLFLCTCGLQSADTPSRRAMNHKQMMAYLRKHSPLTENNFSFRYRNREVVPNQRVVQEISYSIRHFPRMTKNVERFFQNDNSLDGIREYAINAWGGIYSQLPELTESKITVDEYSNALYSFSAFL